MSDFSIHRVADRYVIDAGAAEFDGLATLVRGYDPHEAPSDEPGLVALRKVIRSIGGYLPKPRSYKSWEAYMEETYIDGVDFVSVSSRIVFGVDALVARRLADCLEEVVMKGDGAELHTMTGLWFLEIRTMYLAVSAALGRYRHALRIARGEGGES